MSTHIFSMTGYSHLYRSLLRFCDMPSNEAKSLVYCLNTANLDSVRFENPDVCVIESTPYVFSYRIVSFDCRPYRTEVQLYKSLCALEKSIIREALTDGQREAFERLHCIMSNLEYRFYKTFGVEISDVSTVYSECSFGLVPWVDEPSVCMMHDWIMLPNA